MSTIDDITKAAELVAQARAELAATIRDADTALATVRTKWGDRLRTAAATAAECEADLLKLAKGNQALFTKPQSIEHQGVRVGWRKGKGRLELPDIKLMMKRMAKLLTKPQRAAVIKVEVKVLKGPLARLSGEILQKLGVNTVGAGPEPFVSFPKSDIEKLVDWWLKPIAVSASEEE